MDALNNRKPGGAPPSASGSEEVRRSGVRSRYRIVGEWALHRQKPLAMRTCAEPPQKICSNRLDTALFIDGSSVLTPTHRHRRHISYLQQALFRRTLIRPPAPPVSPGARQILP